MTTTHLLLRTIHISMGVLSLAAGATSMLVRKGSRAHARAGTVFFVAMVIMATSGVSLATFFSPNVGNVMGGLLTLYLTLTAWTTVWRAPNRTGRLETAGAVLGAVTAIIGLSSGMRALSAPTHRFDGYPPAIYFVFSRAGCDKSVRWLRQAGVRLTTNEEAERIRESAETRASWIDEAQPPQALRPGPPRPARGHHWVTWMFVKA